jgi:Ni/Co efflux regulator RcnB
MRKLMVLLAAIAVVATPVHAHARGKGSKSPENSQQTEDKKKKDTAADKAYKDALQSIPEKKVSDPWAKMR